jgi:hypothetical protein
MLGTSNGTFTATSINGDIIDSGFANVVLGGNATVTGTGLISLNATNGDIVLNDSTTLLRSSTGLTFNAKNVNLQVGGVAGSSLVLGNATQNSTVAGNLTVSTTVGDITQVGALRVGGTASFSAFAAGSRIDLTNTSNGFGVLKFFGQTVNVTENGDMVIATGSTATGPASLRSVTGNITVTQVDPGPVIFGSTARLDAGQNITLPKLVQASGQITLAHTGVANLSALSLSGDLNGIFPLDLGPGAGPGSSTNPDPNYAPKP